MALNVMSPGFEIGSNLKFQQRWEFRNGEDDSSSDGHESNSSRHRALEKNELVHDRFSPGDGESSYSRRPQEKGQASCPDGTGRANEKTKKAKARSKKDDNSAKETKKRRANAGAGAKKGKGIAYDPSVASELRAFTKSVVQELEDERIKMVAWMREEIDRMVTGDASARASRKDDACGGDKTEPASHRKSSANGVVLALQTERRKTRTPRGRDKRGELQSQHRSSIEENVKTRDRTRADGDAGARKPKPVRKRQSKGGDSAQPAKRKKASEDPITRPRPAGNLASDGRGSRSKTNVEEVLGTNEPIRSSDPTKSNLQLLPSKLDLSQGGALDWNIGFLEGPLASKIAPDSSNRQAALDGRANGQNTGFLSQLGGLSSHSNPAGSLECSMFPTISKAAAPSENCLLRINPGGSRFSQREALNPVGRLGSLAQACPRKEGSSNHGGAPELTALARLPTALYQGMDASFGNGQLSNLENLLRANESALGLRLSGGAMWGNGHGLSEYHDPNNFLGLVRPSSDGRLAAFQSPDPKKGC